ncbi:alpha/beta-hydrolase family protein [Roseinatronobacter sp. S2]|uniref:alpha/beta hydrolase n=1 Tax=Roseinatronobacter sp. S2 TaxID=3035471 RepID=UPI00240FD7FC|nr:alpha/beta-hydrolase family protein [Roseinatronobacter sp. S2]WFE75004.1 alpha/beta-hydrolase family protein [Roseinatronobacter sp. S2]
MKVVLQTMRYVVAWLPYASLPALILGTLFFMVSLTPSLVPRDTMVQAVLSGVSLAAGHAIGLMLSALWHRLEFPPLPLRARRGIRAVVVFICVLAAAGALWQASEWQNGLRALMEMPPVDTVRPFTIAAGAVAVFLLLVWFVRFASLVVRKLSGALSRVLPGPQALLVSITLTALLFWNIGNGVLVRGALTAVDRVYAGLDGVFEEASPRPEDPRKTGAPGSLLDWEELGRTGRAMIAAGPDQARIEAATGTPALEPLRVYVGLNAAPDPAARAALALAELQRIDAFSRSTLVIATPTGTGTVNSSGQQALEYILHGDVATVSVQYSYVASWLALLSDPEYGVETARAVFAEVYGYWRTLPPDARPALYLNGLSLGALNSELSHDLHQVVGDPFDGALWVGAPFNSPTWSEVTRNRNPDTPAWLPTYRDGSAVRFMNQTGLAPTGTAPWGSFRILYLQHASDAVTFFDPRAAWRRPDWMSGPRGPDVSADLRWLPVVSFLQLGVDIMTAVKPPRGYGHRYSFESYAKAWAMLLDRPDWTLGAIEDLVNHVNPPD